MSAEFARQLLATFDITPQFSGALLGEPDYGAPGDFATFDEKGNIEKIGVCTSTSLPTQSMIAQLKSSQNFAASSLVGLFTRNLLRGASI